MNEAKPDCLARHVMSALGHKQTFCDAGAMSALPPKADIPGREPVSDIDTVAMDSLKALDPKRPIREADKILTPGRADQARKGIKFNS